MSRRYDPFLLNVLESNYTFLLIDTEQIILKISDNYAELFGIEQMQSLGHSIKEKLPFLKFDQVLSTKQSIKNSLLSYFNYQKETSCTMVCDYTPIFQDGQLIGALHTVVYADINEVKKLQQTIEHFKTKSNSLKTSDHSFSHSSLPLSKILGSSKIIYNLKQLIMKIANSKLSVLITGETGTGKEIFANAIHELSNRKDQPFIKINCAAIPKDLLESELFGYAEGAFSGARKGGKIGRFELANNGTILLDEIGEMPLSLQAKLLRVIQEQELTPVGGLKPVKLNVRIICNTNCDLEKMVFDGTFREDLYYRINVVELPLPPLREHLEDIPILCEHFIEKTNTENDLHVTSVHSDIYPFLQSYRWNGNIRELEHTIERACVMCQDGELQLEHFDFLLSRIKKDSKLLEETDSFSITLKNKKNEYEREEIIKALAITKGNKSAAAKYLHISRSVFYTKLKNYNLL